MDVSGTDKPSAAELEQFVGVLDGLITAMQRATQHAGAAIASAESMRHQLLSGVTARDIILNSEGPLLPEIVSSMLRELLDAGSRLRRQEAQALHAEGLAMEAIGQLFGVSRQRVSALIRSSIDEPATWWGDQEEA
jgi:hypothetical protein